MSVARLDLYRDVHKGIRKELFDLTMLAGSTEFQNPESLQQLKDRFSRTYNMLETHSDSEDAYIEPLLKENNSDIAAKLSAAHQELEREFNRLQKLLNSMNSNQENVAVQGQHFYLQLTIFISEYLQHIADEEQIAMPLMWEHLDDTELMRVSVTIRANIPPPAMKHFLACMIPTMNHPERVAMLSGMQKAAPTEVFTGVCQLAQSVLSNSDWQNLEKSIKQQAIA